MSNKITKGIKAEIVQIESDLAKLLDLSHKELRDSSLGQFSCTLITTVMQWYRTSNPTPQVSIAALMQQLGVKFEVPECVAQEFRCLAIPTTDIAPKHFNLLKIYQDVESFKEKAPEVARDLRKCQAASRLRLPLMRWPFEDQGKVVRLEVAVLSRAPDYDSALDPCRKAHYFLIEVACLLDQGPESVPPLSGREQTVEMPGVNAKIMDSEVRIEIDRKTFDWLCETCDVKQANVA